MENKNKIDEKVKIYEKVDEIPFDYNRKKQSIVVKHKNTYRMITKGALEEIIKDCNMVHINDKNEVITEKIKKVIKSKAIELANDGMQVIALAEKTVILELTHLIRTMKRI